ncbi:hypothetical protein [Amorphus sp. 3PC139-8]
MLNELILGRALYCRTSSKEESIIVSSWKAMTRDSWVWIRKRTL